jgi:serine/threonine protein kinase
MRSPTTLIALHDSRESRVLASLNHPNIAAIYGVEESGGRKFLVMELVPGETLSARIKRGPIPAAAALEIATQITNALEAAHEKAVVHRDLKPANVKITPDGKVKVLDFGLAKAYTPDPADGGLSNSPTLSAAATNTGVILGTAAYMSPEQAKGREVDRRTDIFAFGCVLYEMLTGRPAFEGDGVPDILSAVLKSDPDWTRLPLDVPPRIRDLLRVCLQKDAKNRRQTATDVRIDIEYAQRAASDGRSLVAPIGSPRRERVALLALALITLIAGVLGAWALRPTTTGPEARLEISTPPTRNSSLAISPNGLRIVFAVGSARPVSVVAAIAGFSV